METTRQQKVARQIQKELGTFFQKQTNAMGGILISVTVVRLSPDLSVAKVFLSFFPAEKGPELLINIQKNTKQIRKDLGNLMRHQLRIIPELAFFIDDSMEYAGSIDEILDNL